MSKNQINLPKTAFSMKANLPIREPEILKFWKKIDLYKELRNSRKGEEKFVLHDGPPYANGNIHMGTALNKILKDIIVKFHQMDGKDSVYVPGWDCHGLPIEWKIEEQYKKNKKNKNDVPIVEFRKECRTFAEKWIEVHKDQFKRLGVVGDWENYYSTMSYDAEAQIVRELGKFLKEGSLYRGFKPVLWSTVEKTALADAEVEYQDHKSDTIYACFPVKSSKIKELNDCNIVIWTTTPWTIPANKALAYNESLDYLIIQINDDGNFKNKKIVIAEALLESVLKDCEIKEFENLKKFKGKDLKDTICKHPFFDLGYDYDIPMLEARFVTTEQGTGIVHCAPSHGPDDFNLCLNNGIKAIETVDDDGKYTNNVSLFEGLHIFKANPVVIEKLRDQNKLLSNGELVHSYPHSWRSKAPLVHRATPQWFISMESHKLRSKAIKAIDDTTFYPSKGKERLKSMIETRPDWCVSRQRVWGVPLPIFVNKKTKEILVDDEVTENIASIYEKEGSDCWFSDDPQKFLGKKYDVKLDCITISKKQFEYAKKRIHNCGLNEKVNIEIKDYRDLQGKYNSIASIEMIEAVGQNYLDGYFKTIKNNLSGGGKAAIQAITIDDNLFDRYKNKQDFIQKYIFPGGFLPNKNSINRYVSDNGLTINSYISYADHYADTLEIWRNQFIKKWELIKNQGFDLKFKRMWEFYLSYCEAGFKSKNIDLIQFSLQNK